MGLGIFCVVKAFHEQFWKDVWLAEIFSEEKEF